MFLFLKKNFEGFGGVEVRFWYLNFWNVVMFFDVKVVCMMFFINVIVGFGLVSLFVMVGY